MSAPPARTACGSMPLTVAWVPTGMKAGVATRPWDVVISPQRAAPSVAERRNWKASGIGIARFYVRLRPKQQARIPIGIEPVAGRNRMRVGLSHHVETAEGCDQHEQSRARQVEI